MGTLWQQLRWSLPLWAIFTLTNWWPENRVTLRIRGFLARPFIGGCGTGLQLGSQLTILSPSELTVGDNVYLAKGVWLNCLAGLTIEDEVVLSPYVVISTLQHRFKGNSVRFGGSSGEAVVVGRGTWLAAHVSVSCGVRIGQGNLVAANASVVTDTVDGVMLGGVPARVLGKVKEGQGEFASREQFMAKRRV